MKLWNCEQKRGKLPARLVMPGQRQGLHCAYETST